MPAQIVKVVKVLIIDRVPDVFWKSVLTWERETLREQNSVWPEPNEYTVS